MEIVVYICCDAKQRKLGEQSIRLAWIDEAPEIYDCVSMGGERDWCPASIWRYTGDGLSASVVNLYRRIVPERSDWELAGLKEDFPNQSLEVKISEVGSNFLGWELATDGEPPQNNQYILSYGISPAGEKSINVEPWFTTEVSTLECQHLNSDLARLYVSKHIIKAVENKAAEVDLVQALD